jgi:hypothetical protein
MRVVPGRHEHDPGVELACRRRHDVLDERQERVAARPRRHGEIQREPLARPRADVAQRAGAGIERRLVDAREQHVVAAVEDVVRTVAVVHVPVQDQDALGTLIERVLGRDRDSVEETESHRRRPLGVVPGRAHATEGERRATGQQLVHHRARPARGVHRRLVGAPAHDRVGVDRTAARLGRRADRIHVLLGVNRGHRAPVGRGRLAPLQPEPAAGLQHALDRRDPRLVLGMGAGVVLEGARVVEVERRTDPDTVIRP